MNLDGACWHKIKQSGNFKRKVANRCAKIIKNNNSSFSLNQLNGPSVSAEREGNLNTYEENTEDNKSEFLFPTDFNILLPSDIATDHQGANNNTDEDIIKEDISVFGINK